jgi:hypothetical protein
MDDRQVKAHFNFDLTPEVLTKTNIFNEEEILKSIPSKYRLY